LLGADVSCLQPNISMRFRPHKETDRVSETATIGLFGAGGACIGVLVCGLPIAGITAAFLISRRPPPLSLTLPAIAFAFALALAGGIAGASQVSPEAVMAADSSLWQEEYRRALYTTGILWGSAASTLSALTAATAWKLYSAKRASLED